MKIMTFLALFGLLSAAPATEESRAFIELDTDDELTTITAKFTNATTGDVSYDYLLTVTKQGPNGELSSAQGGHFSAAAGETVTLSSSSVNFAPADAIELTLEVLNADDKVLYRDRWHRAPEK